MLLILAIVTRHPDVDSPLFAEDVALIRQKGPPLIKQMIEVCNELNQQANQGMTLRKITTKTIGTLIEFHQFLVQGLFRGDDTLLQLPHFDKDVIKKYKKEVQARKISLKNDGGKSSSILAFCRMDEAERKEIMQ
mgnify:CR=1 FL=1